MGEKGMILAARHMGWAIDTARSFARRFKGADPDDVASTYFRRVAESPDRTAVLDSTEQFKNHSASIMHNAAFNQGTKQVRGLRHNAQYVQLKGLLNASDSIEDFDEAKAAINRVLDRYEDASWVLRMHLDNKSNRWIAKAKGVTDKTIGTWIEKYKAEIANELGAVS